MDKWPKLRELGETMDKNIKKLESLSESKFSDWLCAEDLERAKRVLLEIITKCNTDINGSTSNYELNSRIGNALILLGYEST